MDRQREYRYEAQDEGETETLASLLAEASWPGMVIALDGELGAGKTRFTQAYAKALGIEGVVNSPTFTIIKEYTEARLPLYHMDVYRLTSDEADELGLEEYYEGDGVCVVEWASRVTELLPVEQLSIHIAHQPSSGEQARHFTLQATGQEYIRLCEQLHSQGVLTKD